MNRKKLIINALIIAVTIIFTYNFVYKEIDFGQIVLSLKNVNFGYLVLGLSCMLIFVICEGLNILRTLKIKGKNKGFRHIKYAAAGFFFGSITPSATGGQPMQIMLMKRDGNEIGFSALALLTEAASYQLSGLMLSGFAICYYAFSAVSMPMIAKILFTVGLTANSLVFLFCIMTVFRLEYVESLLNLIKKLKLIRLENYISRMEKKVQKYKGLGGIIKRNKKELVFMQITSLIKVIAYNSISLIVCLALGISVNPILIIIIQSIVNASVSMIPSPGAIGANESVSLILYSQIIAGPLVGTVMIISRLISYYIPVLVTGIMILFSMTVMDKTA